MLFMSWKHYEASFKAKVALKAVKVGKNDSSDSQHF